MQRRVYRSVSRHRQPVHIRAAMDRARVEHVSRSASKDTKKPGRSGRIKGFLSSFAFMRFVYKHFQKFRKNRLRVRAGLAALVFVVTLGISLAMQIVPAYAATVDVNPNTDVTNGWATCTGGTCGTGRYTVIDEGSTPDNTNYISTGTGGSTGEIQEHGLTTTTNVDSVSQVVVKVHAQSGTNANGGTLDTISINLRVNGTLQTAGTCTPAFSSWQWCSDVTFSGTWSQSDLDGMQVQITRNRQGGGSPSSQDDDVRIATAYATVTYVAAISYTQASHRWFENQDNTSYNGGTNWQTATSAANWSTRNDHTTAVFNNKLWVIGGYAGSDKNDVWSSSDGVTWTQETSAAGWSARDDHTTAVFNNKLWVIGGHSSTYLNDVWSSSDGVTWTQATSAAGWSARSNHTTVVYNNKLWVMGGYNGGRNNQVWYSSDGVTWTQATSAAGWSARTRHTSAVFNNKLWVIGGADGGGNKNDVWSSSDGVTWTEATSAAGWSARTDHTTAVFNNKLWVMGGLNSNNVWYSSDGATWTEATSAAGWSTRSSLTSAVFNNKLWVMGGDSGGSRKNDVWYALPTVDSSTVTVAAQDTAGAATAIDGSVRLRMNIGVATAQADKLNGRFQLQYALQGSDGLCDTSFSTETYQAVGGPVWTQEDTAADWSGRAYHTSAVFNNKLWVMGGHNTDTTSHNDVWSSSDGVTWTPETSAAGWSGRRGHETVVFNNKLWVMGGWQGIGGSYYNDVWSSSDGITWTQEDSAADWSVRRDFAAVVFNNKIWVMGGQGDDGFKKNDVWSSSDGITWTQEDSAADWSTRSNFTAAVFNNKLWVMGGDSTSWQNDVWSSTDGVTWIKESSAPWAIRHSHISAVFNNKLWVMGGTTAKNDVWSSSDGATWTQEASAAGWSGRYGSTAEVLNGKLWVMGGDASTVKKNDVWSGNIDIDFQDNPNADPVGATSTVTGDPTAGGTIRPQTYQEDEFFGNDLANIAVGEYGVWDFALNASSTYDKTYCFRVVKSNYTTISTYSTVPELNACSVPTTSYIMRHGKAFCKGVKRAFFWAN